jgi:acetyl-CoA carboxylase biotin carboxyl carrier protein
MSSERIRELLEMMDSHDLAELELEEGEFKVRLAKRQSVLNVQGAPAALPVAPASAPAEAAPEAATAAEDADLVPVESPIVGTFYQAPSPDADTFVKVGDTVNDETVVCIIEAMKVMNEVKAGTSGSVAKILVQNGEAVEYGQPLFLIRP